MPYNYKDLTYLRAALHHYEKSLIDIHPNDTSEEEFSETQEDIQYVLRLIALTQREIDQWENSKPSLTIVKNEDNE